MTGENGMGWGGIVGVTALTTVVGGLAATAVAALLIEWLQISNFEGGSGYFAFFVVTAGVVAGFITGFLSAIICHSGFLKTQGYATGIIALLAVVAAVLPVLLNDKGPKIDGESLVLQVELRCPVGWRPEKSRAALEHGNFCWLQEDPGDASMAENRIRGGGLALTQDNGRWIATGGFDLESTRKHRYVRMFLGTQTNASIEVPLPRHPGRDYKNWSGWSAAGFFAQKDQPVQPGYDYRFRVQGATEYARAHPNPDTVVQEAYKQARAALPPDPSVAQLAPLFENVDGKTTDFYSEPAVWTILEARHAELVPLLRSGDPKTRRQAIRVAGHFQHLPPDLIGPVAEAGTEIVDLIRQANAANADEPDLPAEERAFDYYGLWIQAMRNGGEKAPAAWKPVLERVESAALAGSKEGRIHDIAVSARKELDGIAAAPPGVR
jgi:hypothetical protein